MFKNLFKIFIIIFLVTLPAKSQNFDNILISGNKRISNETILVFSEISDQKFLNEKALNIILKKLYKTGFFKNVNLEIQKNQLTIKVVENPIIQNILIEGIESSSIEESLLDKISLKNRSSFNITAVTNDEIMILNVLRNKGYYFSTLSTSTRNAGNNTIDLVYNIDLGKKARISKISFVGDKIFKDSKLRNIIISEEYKFWKIISGKKFLNEELIRFDRSLLNNYYLNNGFYDVKINSSYANYLGNENFELIYNISSGQKYFFNNINLILPIDYNDSNFDGLRKIFSKLKGEAYSLNSIDKILKEIDSIVLNEEYEFLTSTVKEEVNDELINITFKIQESEKFYVEKINILGNNITREDVIRNRLLVDEGDPYNKLLHNRSINSIKALNFFSSVSDEVLTGSLKNQKIININIEEKPTGEISAGAGVGTSGGTVAFSVKENNFLGRGIQFGTDLTITSESVRGLISLDNPNYQGSGRSINFSAESSVTDRLENYGYKSNKTGFAFGSGFEFYDDLFLITGISSYIENLETDSTASTSIKKQEGNYFDTFFNYTFDYDKRDQKYQTSDGYRSRFTQNLPLISKNDTITNSYDYRLYNKWLDENIGTLGFFASAANSLSGNDVKLSDRLFISGKKLRGFEQGRVGPKDGADYVGGNYVMSINLATTLPQILPDLQSVDFSIFFDAANIWGVDYDSNISDGSKIRSSVGIAMDLFTPIGPLNFSLTEVITKKNTDITESFRFNLGTTF
tara:strand:- start:995 stop:3232 length:2238 start_codon:yes stop_codon:yes gene_type:complete